MNVKKIESFLKIYPWYYGFNADLLFFIAIDTLFLTVVKGLSAAQFSLLTTISIISGIVLQLPMLKIIKKIGNTKSIRLGSFLLLLSAVFLTFSNTYFGLMIGMIFYDISFIFKNMTSVSLRGNLKYLGKEKDFVKISNQANTIYAVVTAVIAVCIGPLFNLNNYLPMYLCIIAAFLCFIISFKLYDVSELNETSNLDKINIKQKVPWNLLLILLMLSYGLSFGCIATGQNEGKLFIQYDLASNLNTEQVALALGFIVAISRGARVFANIIFTSIYEKLGNHVGKVLSYILVLCPSCLLLGHFLDIPFWYKISIMSFGFFLILAVRDPIKVYIQDVLFQKCPKGYEQDLITYLALFRSLGTALVSMTATLILFYHTLSYVVFMVLIVSLICFLIMYKIYSIIKEDEKDNDLQHLVINDR